MLLFRRSPTVIPYHLFQRSYASSTRIPNVMTDLTNRGLIANTTSPDLVEHTNTPTAIYCGVDPTASSLHLGNLLTLMGLFHFHIRGHQTIALVGGATGSIGDPSGRNSERLPLEREVLDKNVAGIDQQIHRFFHHGALYAQRRGYDHVQLKPKVLNNYTWFSNMTALDFLGSVGRYARINTMLAKESVRSRLESTQGISFTEFSYQLLQAYDFWYLYNHHGCRIQLGGSDQWGNITAGIDMIGKRNPMDQESPKAYGITIPLLLTSTGEKFGKSAGNAVWLDKSMTSVFDFYQFFMKTTDHDVGKYLSMFTLFNDGEIQDLLQQHKKNPELRLAQESLASEVTELVHGLDAVQQAKVATKVLFGQDLSNVSGQDILNAFEHDHSRFASLEQDKVVGVGIDQLATMIKATKSKSEAQKLIKAGGMYINNVRVMDSRQKISSGDLIDNTICLLRVGKSSYHIVHVRSSKSP
ncbi:tyrosine-tRNA ligase [Halteromyces radiatus]|uniref:tyrosine-tRNA ligase n=1 Tax=Halteromyces radiatus TaxID=101107 RepID=UPI00221EB0E1|nr:tyrosine-tRNA ligase [Halteromyces radiatus]KAI8078771.1 tyrosine-tRNA ligase [Halteromyces radiatus]